MKATLYYLANNFTTFSAAKIGSIINGFYTQKQHKICVIIANFVLIFCVNCGHLGEVTLQNYFETAPFIVS